MARKDPELLRMRAQKLKERYDYWYNQRRRRHDDVLRILRVEFFLETDTIELILNGKYKYGSDR